MTTEIISMKFKGIELQAIRSCGCKYSRVVIKNDGQKWNSGCSTVREADEYFSTHEDIKKMVLYIYHPNKRTFTITKYYER